MAVDKGGVSPVAIGLVIVLAVCVFLGFNYKKNVEAEKKEEEARPYSGYTLKDVTSMLEGYEIEVEKLEKQLVQLKAKRTGVKYQQLHGDRAKEFQRVSEQGNKERALFIEINEMKETITELQAEKAIQERGTEDAMKIHMRRLFDFSNLSG